MGAIAMPAGLLVRHERTPNGERVEIIPLAVDERLWVGLHQPRDEPLTQDAALGIAPIRHEPVADDRLAITDHIRLDGHYADDHGRKRDVRVTDVRCDRR